MVVVPAAIPVTIPADPIVAIAAELLLHVPPDTVLVSVVVAVAQTVDEPDIVPAFG